jgi:hypothetical protein
MKVGELNEENRTGNTDGEGSVVNIVKGSNWSKHSWVINMLVNNQCGMRPARNLVLASTALCILYYIIVFLTRYRVTLLLSMKAAEN